jgi:transposase InsO family protein
MMLDRDIVAVSPSSTYRVLKEAGLLRAWNRKESKKGTGFQQPLGPHEHWHIDVSYLNICGTFYYFCGLLDGYSRYIVHWEIREAMTEADIEIIIERAREQFPDAHARIISDAQRRRLRRVQRTAVHRARLQRVYPPVRYDPRANVAILSPKQRKNGVLPSLAEVRMYPTQDTRLGRGRAPHGRPLRGPLLQRKTPQRHRLHRASGQTRRPKPSHLRAAQM